jgi:soluble lytic murein transglycosylase-like protein
MTAFVQVFKMFLLDVWGGLRVVSHNALAMLGLAAVALSLFVAGRADVRMDLETQALGWLNARAALRSGVAAGPTEDEEVDLAMAEPEAIQRATATNPAELSRQQASVAYWISRRYSVAPEPISRLVQEAWELGKRVNIDPTLLLGVMAVESGFNPFAQSHVGAQGLMQVMTRIHHDKYQSFGGMNAAFDPVTNLRVGAQVLRDCIRKAGSLEIGLKHYVGAANLVDDGGYAAKVMAEAAYLKQVAGGAKVPSNAPLPQPQAVAEAPAANVVTPSAAKAAGQDATPPATTHTPQAVPAPAASEATPVVPVAKAPAGQRLAMLDTSASPDMSAHD